MDEDQIFIALTIRDIINHNSTESSSGPKIAKTVFVENGLNQQVTFQLQGARNATWVNVGATWNQAANSNGYQTVSDYFPKFRVQASCAVAPTTGALDIWIIRV